MAVKRGKAIFIDKDGTLIHDVPQNVDSRYIRLMTDAGRSLRILKMAGYRLIVISNQPGVAINLFKEQDLLAVNRQIQTLLAPHGVTIDAFYYCPHEASDGCCCRKPMPGMILRAVEEHHVDPGQSWMIGDILHDVEAGNRAGCHTIHFDNGNETEWLQGAFRQPDHSVKSLSEAVDIVCRYASQMRRYEQ